MLRNYIFASCSLLLLGAGCQRARASVEESFQGVVEYDDSVLGFEVPGRVLEIPVKRGETIHAGELLAKLDDRLERSMRDMRAAEERVAQAELMLLKAGPRRQEVRRSSADLRAAEVTEDVARRTFTRQRGLAENGAVPPASVDDLEGTLDRASATKDALKAHLSLIRAGARREELVAAGARLSAATAGLTAEETRLADHELHGPAGGVVLEVHVQPGEVVSPGTPVVTVGDPDHPYVDVFVPEANLAGLRVGGPVSLRVDSAARVFHATIENIHRRLEFTPRLVFSERERPNLVIRVRVRITDAAGQLYAGVPAFVRFER